MSDEKDNKGLNFNESPNSDFNQADADNDIQEYDTTTGKIIDEINKQPSAPDNNQTDDKTQKTGDQKDQNVDWEKRYKDGQKFINQLTEERKTLKQQLDNFESMDLDKFEKLQNLENVISSNPQLMTQIEQHIIGKQSIPSAQEDQKSNNIPDIPAEFDPYDLGNPNTPTGKWYMAQQEKVRESTLNSIKAIFDERDARAAKEKEEKQARQQRQENEKRIADFLEKQADLSSEKKERFVEFLNKGPKALGLKDGFQMEHLFQLYNILDNQNFDNGKEKKETQLIDLDSKINGDVTPPRDTKQQSMDSKEFNERDAFMSGFFQRQKKRSFVKD